MINKLEKHFDKIGYLVLGCFFVYLNYKLYVNMDLLVDSDMASEMLYGYQLLEKKALFLKDWYYSTAIETLDIPLIFAPLFIFTKNWHTVRIIGIVILDIMLFLSFYYVCKVLDIKHIPWIGMLILGTISNEYFDFVLKGSYYVPYLAVSFVSFGLVLDICKRKEISKIKLVLLLVLSVLSGLNGLRQIAQCYICLFGTSFLLFIYHQYKNLIKKTINLEDVSCRLLIVSFTSLIFSVIGYFINKLLLEPNFSFKTDWGVKIELASIKRIMDVVYGWATMFGYETAQKSSFVISFMFILLIVISCLYSVIKYRNRNPYYLFTVLLFITSSIITLSIFTFTSMTFAIRYFIQVFTNCVFVVGILISSIQFDIKKVMICLVLSASVFMCSKYQLNKDILNSTNKELIEIRDILLEKNIYEGYGSFWNANVLTEMSDGIIEVWNFHNYEEDDDVSIKELDQWLQKKEHFERNPIGATFIILTNRQYEKIGFKSDVSDNLVYKGQERMMFIFENYEELEASICGN